MSRPLDPARVAEVAGRTALCLDFDGTLAPIVDDPEAAAPLEGTLDLLGRLAGRFAAVALVSGRPAGWLAERAAAPGVRYLGLYGLEEVVDGLVHAAPEAEAVRPAARAALAGSRRSSPPSCATSRRPSGRVRRPTDLARPSGRCRGWP